MPVVPATWEVEAGGLLESRSSRSTWVAMSFFFFFFLILVQFYFWGNHVLKSPTFHSKFAFKTSKLVGMLAFIKFPYCSSGTHGVIWGPLLLLVI
jgi:hypothetical protein